MNLHRYFDPSCYDSFYRPDEHIYYFLNKAPIGVTAQSEFKDPFNSLPLPRPPESELEDSSLIILSGSICKIFYVCVYDSVAYNKVMKVS